MCLVQWNNCAYPFKLSALCSNVFASSITLTKPYWYNICAHISVVVSIQKVECNTQRSEGESWASGWGSDSYVQQPEESPLVSKHLFHPMNRMPPPELYYNSKNISNNDPRPVYLFAILVTALRDLRFHYVIYQTVTSTRCIRATSILLHLPLFLEVSSAECM